MKVFTNLAALAASAVRHQKSSVRVGYFAQDDMKSWAVRRSKFGAKRSDFLVQLEGSDLTVTRRPRRFGAAAAAAAEAEAEAAAAAREAAAANPVADAGMDAPPLPLPLDLGTPPQRPLPPPPPPMLADAHNHRKLLFNVREDDIRADPERCELILHRRGRERPLRLQLKSDEICLKWQQALHAARTCNIEMFFTLGQSLGRGAYGEVVVAVDVNTKEKRAVKIVKRGTSLKSVEHLTRELQVMQSVNHPGIVKTYQIFAGKTIFVVMEYVPGGDLFDFVAQQEKLTEAQGSETMGSILKAVTYLHSINIVHRDLKPENILCSEKSWPLQTKLADFGFSTVLDPDGDSNMRTPVGTAYFMAPEIITSKGHGQPVDLWACGVILYTILTGRLPFPGRNRAEYFRNVGIGNALYPPSLWKGISENALNLVKGLLNMDPKKRLTALGAVKHTWIDTPAPNVEIKRNRANLHSRRRKLYKARSAIIAVAMAQKFKATALVELVEKFPEVVEKVGDQTKNFANKTADNFMDAGDRLGEGTRKLKENVGEGTRKFKENVGENKRKFGEGVKKTGRGMENGARKMGEGVKKTGDAIGSGAKKAAGGIGTGVKKTAEGIGNGAKKTKDVVGSGVKKTTDGIKKTGEGIKKGAEKVKIDKLKIPLENLRPKFGGSQAGQQPGGNAKKRDRDLFRRKARAAAAQVAVNHAVDALLVPGAERVITIGEDGVGRTGGIEVSEQSGGNSPVSAPTSSGVARTLLASELEPVAVAKASSDPQYMRLEAESDSNLKSDTHEAEQGATVVNPPAKTLERGVLQPPKIMELDFGGLTGVVAAAMEKQTSQVSNASAEGAPDVDTLKCERKCEPTMCGGVDPVMRDAVVKHSSHVSTASSACAADVPREGTVLRTTLAGSGITSGLAGTDPAAVEKHSSHISNSSSAGGSGALRLRPKLAPLAPLLLGMHGDEASAPGVSDLFALVPDSGSSDDYATGAVKLRKAAALLLASPDVPSALTVPSKAGVADHAACGNAAPDRPVASSNDSP